MGFRCPKCKKDFDRDRDALLKHFAENEDCTAEAVHQYAIAMNDALEKEKNNENSSIY